MNKTFLFTLVLLATVFAQQGLLGLAGNNLVSTFADATTTAPSSTNTYTGLRAATGTTAVETLLSIATYPTNLNGVSYVYGLTSQNRVVYLNQNDNTVFPITTLTCNPASGSNPTLSIDFDPTTGNLYILTLVISTVTNTNLYRANPSTGACTNLSPTTLTNGQTPQPAGLAFVYNSNSNNPYAIESLNNTLSTVNLGSGVLPPVGSLSATPFSGVGGLTYNYAANRALAALYNNPAADSNLYTINLSTGAATPLSNLQTTNLLGLTSLNGGSFPSGVIGGNPPGFPFGATTTTSGNPATTTTTNGNAFTTTVNGNTNGATSIVASVMIAAALALAF